MYIFRLQAGVTPDHDDPLRFGALLVEDNFYREEWGSVCRPNSSIVQDKVRKQFKKYILKMYSETVVWFVFQIRSRRNLK